MTDKLRIRLFGLDDDEASRIVIKDAVRHTDLPLEDVEIFEDHDTFFDNFDEHVHIAIIDHQLDDRIGSINGLDVMKRVLKINPQCQVIIATGNSDWRIFESYSASGAKRVLYKHDPLFPGKLATSINSLYHYLKEILLFWETTLDVLANIETKANAKT